MTKPVAVYQSMRSYEEARKYAVSSNIKSFREWFKHCRDGLRPKDIPGDPSSFYRDNGWAGWGRFLGTGRVSNAEKNARGYFFTYSESRKICHSLNIRSIAQWREFASSPQRPQRVPAAPNVVYLDKGWSKWSSFLAPKFFSFDNARAFVRKIGLSSNKEWRAWARSDKRPSFIPANPERYYMGGWNGWRDFLGTKNSK